MTADSEDSLERHVTHSATRRKSSTIRSRTVDPIRRPYERIDLFPTRVIGPTGLTTTADYDYGAMQPKEVTDPNNNRTVKYTPLGLPKCMAVMGAKNEGVGDTLAEPGTCFEYDFLGFEESLPDDPNPIYVHTIKREEHERDRQERIQKEKDRRTAAGEDALTEEEILRSFRADDRNPGVL